MMGFSDKQVRQLRARLKPRHVRSRMEDGNNLHYVEGWHVIAEANRIFGFDGWDREMVESSCVYTKHLGVRFEAVYVARIRITVKTEDGTITREGSGTGEASTSSPGKAHELALKAAETDATKRALMTFGNAFGLSLYDPNSPLREKVAPSLNGQSGGHVPAMTGTDRPAPTEDGPAGRGERAETPATVVKPGLNGTQNGTNGHHHSNGAHGEASEVIASDSREILMRPAERHDGENGDHGQAEGDQSTARNDCSECRSAPGDQEQTASPPDTAATRARDAKPSVEPTVLQQRIDKSALTLSEPKRRRDPEHLKFVVKHGCILCGRNRTHAHHLTFAQPHALGRKVSDEFTVPLCARHHQELHHAGDEENWWRNHSVDPLAVADDLWERSRRSRVSA